MSWPIPNIDRFLSKVEMTVGCWTWQGALTDDGYGRFHVRLDTNSYRGTSSHRFAYEHYVGPVQDGLQIDHLCRNRARCNPLHLEAVSSDLNNERKVRALGQGVFATHCAVGHEMTPENTRRRLGHPFAVRCRTCVRLESRRRVAAA